MTKKVISLEGRARTNPGNAPAERMYRNFQAVDDAAELAEMARFVRNLDKKDEQSQKDKLEVRGNGTHLAAIQEAFVICREDLSTSAISDKTKIVILNECVPVLFSLVSASFKEDLSLLFQDVVTQTILANDPVKSAAVTAVEKICSTGKIDESEMQYYFGDRARAQYAAGQLTNA